MKLPITDELSLQKITPDNTSGEDIFNFIRGNSSFFDETAVSTPKFMFDLWIRDMVSRFKWSSVTHLQFCCMHKIVHQNKFVGWVTFSSDPNVPCSNISWYLDANYHGQGIMTKAVSIFLDEVRLNTDLPGVCAFIEPCNKASIALAKKIGFSKQDNMLKVHNKHVDKYFLEF